MVEKVLEKGVGGVLVEFSSVYVPIKWDRDKRWVFYRPDVDEVYTVVGGVREENGHRLRKCMRCVYLGKMG